MRKGLPWLEEADSPLKQAFAGMRLERGQRGFVLRHDCQGAVGQNTFLLEDGQCVFRRLEPGGVESKELLLPARVFLEIESWLNRAEVARRESYEHPDMLDGDCYFVLKQEAGKMPVEKYFMNPGLSNDPDLVQLDKALSKIRHLTPFGLRWLSLGLRIKG